MMTYVVDSDSPRAERPLHPSVVALMQKHRMGIAQVHDDLDATRCLCRRDRDEGETCRDCGGMTVRTGTCTTCTECGTTGGCG